MLLRRSRASIGGLLTSLVSVFPSRSTKPIDEAYRIDEENGNSYWADALKKEISKVSVAWEAYNKGLTPREVRAGKAPDLIGFQEIGCHDFLR